MENKKSIKDKLLNTNFLFVISNICTILLIIIYSETFRYNSKFYISEIIFDESIINFYQVSFLMWSILNIMFGILNIKVKYSRNWFFVMGAFFLGEFLNLSFEDSWDDEIRANFFLILMIISIVITIIELIKKIKNHEGHKIEYFIYCIIFTMFIGSTIFYITEVYDYYPDDEMNLYIFMQYIIIMTLSILNSFRTNENDEKNYSKILKTKKVMLYITYSLFIVFILIDIIYYYKYRKMDKKNYEYLSEAYSKIADSNIKLNSNDIILVEKDGKYGYINKNTGKYEIECEYDFLSNNENGNLVVAKKDNTYYLLSLKGDVLNKNEGSPFPYFEPDNMNEGHNISYYRDIYRKYGKENGDIILNIKKANEYAEYSSGAKLLKEKYGLKKSKNTTNIDNDDENNDENEENEIYIKPTNNSDEDTFYYIYELGGVTKEIKMVQNTKDPENPSYDLTMYSDGEKVIKITDVYLYVNSNNSLKINNNKYIIFSNINEKGYKEYGILNIDDGKVTKFDSNVAVLSITTDFTVIAKKEDGEVLYHLLRNSDYEDIFKAQFINKTTNGKLIIDYNGSVFLVDGSLVNNKLKIIQGGYDYMFEDDDSDIIIGIKKNNKKQEYYLFDKNGKQLCEESFDDIELNISYSIDLDNYSAIELYDKYYGVEIDGDNSNYYNIETNNN